MSRLLGAVEDEGNRNGLLKASRYKELESAQEEMELSFDVQIWKTEDQHGSSGMKTEKQGNNPANVRLLVSMQASYQVLAELGGSSSGSSNQPSIDHK